MPLPWVGGVAGPAGSYVSGSALVVDGAQWLYKKPGVPMDVVLRASRGEQAAYCLLIHSMIDRGVLLT